MDELEYAAQCGFDAICVNEHHSNGYGLMPSPNLIASSLARRTTDTAICVMGNSLALYNPPTRVAEEFAMIDCISGGRLIAGFPVGTPMDTCLRLWPEPVDAAPALPGGARPGGAGLDGEGHLRVQRPLQPAALREHLAAPVQQPHPPIWMPGGGSVETWQWCAEMDYVYCYLSYYGYKAGQRHDGRASGTKWRDWARTAIRTAPASCNSSASAKAASTRSISTPRRRSISTAAACMSIRAGPRRPATPAKAASVPASKAR